jgi:hypothetical protein
MFFPPHFPERTAGLFALVRYLVEEKVGGDVVECGVGRGGSFFLLGCFMLKLEHPGFLFGYDSFQGFPEPSAADASPRNPRKGEWGDTSEGHVREHFVDAGIGSFFDRRCRLIPGFFDKTLAGPVPFSQLSMLHLDVDLYDSYLAAGTILEPLVAENGIALFDEYNQPLWPGATKAVDEILSRSKRTLLHSRFMDKHIAISKAALARPSMPLQRLLTDLQLQPVDRSRAV